MSAERVKRKLSAILSADVVGYSRLMGEDEVSTVRTLEAYRKVMSDLIEQFRGRVVDSPGDNLLAEFGSVVDAVQCAVEIHEVIRAKNEELPEDRRMLFRMGVNLGDVIEEGDRIYGDGVNIAARLEGLAEAGGICISGSAHEQIKNKLALGYEYIGEHTVKNIAEPLKVYKVPVGPKAAFPKEGNDKRTKLKNWRWAALGAVGAIIVIIGALAIWYFSFLGPSIEPASVERMAYPLPDKPSIAVLPFTNMSGDPEQDYIGDGLSESIISALSVTSEMFVMSRSATFNYKGKPVIIRQVAEDLGVQYVLEGSIIKSGDRIRVTAQLIDSLSGHHLWADAYDREMRELFELIDEITKKIVVSIVVSIGVEMGGAEDFRVLSTSTDNHEAWKHFTKGTELALRLNLEDNAKARKHMEDALALDPEYVGAMTLLSNTHLLDTIFGWSDSPLASMGRAFELAQKAVELDEQDPSAHAVLGWVCLYQRQYERAINEGTRAITLNPNYVFGHVTLAHAMHFSGRFEEAITPTKKAYRLNPSIPRSFLFPLVASYTFLKRYEEALEICKSTEEDPLMAMASSWVYQELGREEEARAYLAKLLNVYPDTSLEMSKGFLVYKNPAHLERVLDAFRKAGMPEKPPGAVQEKPSIAVLPFDDLSPEKDQEYFVLGLSEEILNSLAQIPDLTVIAKTSSFSFKGTNKTIQEMASVLDVEHILEGSVRKAENAIRITAQLIKAVDGSHLWSETYDRELKDIFKIQEDIANNVADKLKLTLESLKLLGGTENIKAYEFFLVAIGQYSDDEDNRAVESIDAAIELDPEFAVAWARKGMFHLNLALSGPVDLSSVELEKGLNSALQAIQIEPKLGKGYLTLGSAHMVRGQFTEAEKAYREGIKLTTESLDYFHYGLLWHYTVVGYIEKSFELLRKMPQNDPLNSGVRMGYLFIAVLQGDLERAEEEYERCKEIFGDQRLPAIFIANARLAANDVLSVDDIPESLRTDPVWSILIDHIESPKEVLKELRLLCSNDKNLSSEDFEYLACIAAHQGDPDFALSVMERAMSLQATGFNTIWLPVMREVRQLPRFKEFVKETGLVEYWKEYGWPDLCRPVGDDDFVCD